MFWQSITITACLCTFIKVFLGISRMFWLWQDFHVAVFSWGANSEDSCQTWKLYYICNTKLCCKEKSTVGIPMFFTSDKDFMFHLFHVSKNPRMVVSLYQQTLKNYDTYAKPRFVVKKKHRTVLSEYKSVFKSKELSVLYICLL